MEETLLTDTLDRFYHIYGDKLKKEYDSTPLNLSQLIKYAIFDLARDLGPEATGWKFNHGIPELPEEKIWQVGMTCMLVLMNQVEGARKRVLSFQPFIETEEIACIYLFQLPIEGARGNAFDASIILMGNYEDRAILYENHKKIENILSDTADDCVRTFIDRYKSEPQSSQIDRTIFHKILGKALSKLSILPITLKTQTNLKSEMQDSVRNLTKNLFLN